MNKRINLNELREKLTKVLVSSLLATSIYKLIACKKYLSAFAVSFILICGIKNEYDDYKKEKEILRTLSEDPSGFI